MIYLPFGRQSPIPVDLPYTSGARTVDILLLLLAPAEHTAVFNDITPSPSPVRFVLPPLLRLAFLYLCLRLPPIDAAPGGSIMFSGYPVRESASVRASVRACVLLSRHLAEFHQLLLTMQFGKSMIRLVFEGRGVKVKVTTRSDHLSELLRRTEKSISRAVGPPLPSSPLFLLSLSHRPFFTVSPFPPLPKSS